MKKWLKYFLLWYSGTLIRWLNKLYKQQERNINMVCVNVIMILIVKGWSLKKKEKYLNVVDLVIASNSNWDVYWYMFGM